MRCRFVPLCALLAALYGLALSSLRIGYHKATTTLVLAKQHALRKPRFPQTLVGINGI